MKKVYKLELVPIVEFVEKNGKIHILIELPSATSDGIDLKIEDNKLYLRAEMGIHLQAEEKITFMEFSSGVFVLNLDLGEELETQNVKAKFERGILTLIFAYKEKEIK